MTGLAAATPSAAVLAATPPAKSPPPAPPPAEHLPDGLDALLDPWNLVFGLSVMFLARVLGLFYIINNVADGAINTRARRHLIYNVVPFLVLFLSFLVRTLLKDGFAYNPETGTIFMEPMKYLHNMTVMWYVSLVFLTGVALLLFAVVRTMIKPDYLRGIWPAGIGVVLTVIALLLLAGWNNTAYYPSTADLQSSLTIVNSCSSKFTLSAMSVVSLLIPFVLAYIFYAWRAIDSKKIDREEIKNDEAY